MTLDRMKLSAQTVRDNIAILEEVKEPDDAGYELQLEHEKFILECIEKQIPKKVISTPDYHKHFCPACHHPIKLGKWYCASCGQKIGYGSDTK
jgi:hypothetical protein